MAIDKPWIRNEWAWDEDLNAWTQQGHLCCVNRPETEHGVFVITSTWKDHQWFRTPDLILGIPPEQGAYLVTFHKEVR